MKGIGDLLGELLILGVFAAFVAYFVVAWKRIDFSIGDGVGEVRYSEAVSLWKCQPPSWEMWYLKIGAGSLVFTVKDDVITVRCPGWPRRLASVFGLDYTFVVPDVSIDGDVVGVGTERRLKHETVVIDVQHQRTPIQLAVAPRDHDLQRLREALVGVGVTN
jgi:hypothetical protein